MISISRHLSVCFMFFTTCAVMAQSNAGAAYSLFGIGSLQNSGFGIYSTMGHTGIGLRSDLFINNTNPAAINAVRMGSQIFDIGFDFGSVNQQSSTQSESRGYSNLSHLNLWFKPSPKWAFNVGMHNVSSVSYNIIGGNNSSEELGLYNVNYQGTGGLSELSVTPAFGIGKQFNIGLKLGYLFGLVDRFELVNVLSSGEQISVQNIENISSPMVELGTQYDINIGQGKLTIGLIARPSFLTTTNISSYLYSFSSDTLQGSSKDRFLIPAKLGVGIGFNSQKWMLGIDASYELWEDNDLRDEYDYENVLRISSGLSFVKDRLSPDYLDRIIWSVGVSTNNYYQKINNQPISEFGFSAGVSLPIGVRRGSISIAYDYGQTGRVESGLIKEENHLINLSISLRELWFVKKKYY